MSFITKRERVFHELDLFDLPARNEGKLKAYASCTDARAWSHFGSSKTEHLTELIKRNNNVTASAKYVPTTVIVDTLMVSKNLEIARLKRKIEEFEQMLAVYEELELDCEQKCEIAKAHAAIKAANKDLDDLCLNLNMSTFTDGIDTESFETGKSRSVQYSMDATHSIKSRGAESDRSHGDAWTIMSHEKDVTSQANQTSPACPCDASVSVQDPRIDEMQDQIIAKDAKLNAMHNSLAIMENDICEPFVIYAHIYTALEKIYGVLSQNSKYRQYLNLMTAGKDIRCIDIKGKILIKMKVLEKFCLALIAPCSKEFNCTNAKDCSCYRAEVDSSMSLTYHVAPEECTSSHSTKRSLLVADIMEHEEMKEILSKDNTDDKIDDFEIDDLADTACSINEENQKRIKDLQECYEDLLNCYENLKHETDCIRVRCAKYEELELELERLRGQLKEYNSLWNEKEHYRKRSGDLDSLKQQYMVLAEESSDLETKLKAESEINRIKADAIDELRNQNISLEKRLNELLIAFEKDKSNLQCQLQESECKCMCQEQQIKSLSTQLVKLLEQAENIPHEDTANTLFLTEENETLKEQLKHYQDIEHEFRDKISLIIELEAEIAKWRAAYKEAADRNTDLENCIYNEKERLLNENRELLDQINDKSAAVDNLMGIIKTKSLQIKNLTDDNQTFRNKLELLEKKYDYQVNSSRQESQELLRKVKDYDDFVKKQEDLSNVIEDKMHEYESLKTLLKEKLEENEKLKNDFNVLQNEDAHNKQSMEMAKKKISITEQKLSNLEDVSQQFVDLKAEFQKLSEQKNELENELGKKSLQLESAIYSVKLNKKESGELLNQTESIKNELAKLNLENQTHASKNEFLQKEIDTLLEENLILKNKSARLSGLEEELSHLRDDLNELRRQKEELAHAFEVKNQECSNLYDKLQNEIDENRFLIDKLNTLQSQHSNATNSIKNLENNNERNQMAIDALKRESLALTEKLRSHNTLENQYQELESDHKTANLEKERLQRELEAQLSALQKLNREKSELQNRNDFLLAHNNDLEKTLMTTRNELLSAKSSPPGGIPYANLMEEINKMKGEKVAGQDKIRELLDRLDESEQVIASFQEDVNARDHKIAVMQNQINSLEDEVRRLQDLLEHAIEAGHDIQTTNESIEQTWKQMDARHSRASHNMKLELAMLQRSKSKLESQLSITKSQNEISSEDKQKSLSEIKDLKNDRVVIIQDIKQLEIYSVGDSELTPDDCDLERILDSLHRIRKAFDTSHTKNISLENKLAKVNASSQLFLNKADEAKNFFENEKQKIIAEKEDALQQKLGIERELHNMKKELDRQITRDAKIIKDLEAEILNQKLIIDKIDNSTKTHIKKLEDEMQALQDLYQNALSKIRELKEKLDSNTAEKNKKENIIQNLIADLENKSKETAELQSEIANLAKKPIDEIVQKPSSTHYKNTYSQTDDNSMQGFHNQKEIGKKSSRVSEINVSKRNKSQHREYIQPVYDLLPQQQPPAVNEVQILAAEVEPTFDFVRSSYLNYKIKRLSPGLLEHHSIPSLIDGVHSDKEEPGKSSNYRLAVDSDLNKLQDIKTESNHEYLIDIYQNSSDDNHSSNIIEVNTQKPKSVTNGKVNDSVSSIIKQNTKVRKEITATEDQSDTKTAPADSDILIIFKDTHKSNGDKSHSNKNIQPHELQNKLINKKSTRSNESVNKSYDKEKKATTKFETINIPLDTKETKLDKAKQELNINLPRVGVDQHSFISSVGYNVNPLDSYTPGLTKKTVSDTTVMISSSSENISKYGAPSRSSMSNAENIDLQSTNFITLPAKDPLFTRNRYQSEINKEFDNNKDQFTDRKHTGRIKEKPHHFFSHAEKVAKSGDNANNSTIRFVASDENVKRRSSSILQEDLKQDGLNNRSLDPFAIDTNIKARIGKTLQQNMREPKNNNDRTDDDTGHIMPDEKSKTRVESHFTEISDHNSDDSKGNFIIDEYSDEKTGISPQYSPAKIGGRTKLFGLAGHFVTDGNNKAKTSKLPSNNVDQKNTYKNNLMGRKTKLAGKIPGGIFFQDSDINYDSMLSPSLSESKISEHDIGRVEADIFLKSRTEHPDNNNENNDLVKLNNFALKYIMDSVMPVPGDILSNNSITTNSNERYSNANYQSTAALPKRENIRDSNEIVTGSIDKDGMLNLDNSKYYQNVINTLRKSLGDIEKDHKMQIEAIKIQYDRNINNIINEHNQGVRNIQSIHEDTLQDIMRIHENEVENLRSMSIEAMRKAEKLEKECMVLKSKISLDNSTLLDEVPTKCVSPKKYNDIPQSNTKVLTKTTIEAFNVKPKMRVHGPCTCSLDVNISDTIRNIFEQVDVEQRKMAELTYLKYIASKISNGHIESLDTQELSFLHLKVCRTWKLKLNKEEALQKKIDSLEVELINKQRSAQQHMAELDRKVAEEKQRLEEVREAVCRSTPADELETTPLLGQATTNCGCVCDVAHNEVEDRRSAGDLVMAAPTGLIRPRKPKVENRGATARAAVEERRDRRLYTDEPPTRLRRHHDRPPRPAKK